MIYVVYRELSENSPAFENANWMLDGIRNALTNENLTVVEYSNTHGIEFNRGDVVYFRNIGSRIDQCLRLTRLAVDSGARVIDSYLQDQYTNQCQHFGPRDKVQLYDDMLLLGVNTPRTFCVGIEEFAQSNYTGVIKTVRGGRQGNGTYLLLDDDERRRDEIVQDILNKPRKGIDGVIVQDYIPNRGDIRVFTIGGRVVAAMKRKPKDIDRLKLDKSEGTSKALLHPMRDIIHLAERAAQGLRVDVASMDILRDVNSDRLYVVDFNESPTAKIISLRTRTNIPQLIVDYLNTISRGV